MSDPVEIPLTQGKVALVDKRDLQRVSQFKWFYDKSHTAGDGYARTWLQRKHKRKSLRMHRFILGVEDSRTQVDHINGNTLDNRRSNLRIVSNADNAKNRRISKANTTGYKGVSYYKARGKYGAYIYSGGKNTFLGLYLTVEEAAAAYDRAAVEHHGKFARTNKQIREESHV